MNLFYLLIGLIVIVGLWIVGVYNFFVSSRTRVGAARQEN